MTGCVAALHPSDPPGWEHSVAASPDAEKGSGVYYRNATSDTTLTPSLFDMLVGVSSNEAGSVVSTTSTFDRDCVYLVRTSSGVMVTFLRDGGVLERKSISVETVNASILRRDVVWRTNGVPPLFWSYREQEAWLAWTEDNDLLVSTKSGGVPLFLLMPVFGATSRSGGRFEAVDNPDVTCFVF